MNPIGIFGQILGTIVGSAAGTVVQAPQQSPAVVTPASQPNPQVEAPSPKPLIKSKTAWFNVLFPILILLLEHLSTSDLSDFISNPAVIAALQGAINILLRILSGTGIAIPHKKQ
jgi:hypothetical protein